MFFKQLFDQDSSTYTYLLADDKSGEAIVIDPVKEHVSEYLDLLKESKLQLKYTLDTHVHADHITGSGLLRKKTGAESVLEEHAKSPCVSKLVKDGELLNFGSHQIKVIHTPGHTLCHASYLIEDRVFTGDALFICGCGRTDFQEGSAETLWDSVIKKLFTLNPDTLVYPGHDYKKQHVSSIAQEKDLNPRFKNQTKESFVKLMSELNLPDPKWMMEAVPANERCGLD